MGGVVAAGGVELFLFLDGLVLLDAVEDAADGVAQLGSGEGAGGTAYDASGDRSAGGRDAFGLELIVLPGVAGFDFGLGAGVRGFLGVDRLGEDKAGSEKSAGEECKSNI
jgi:hypothetical protein